MVSGDTIPSERGLGSAGRTEISELRDRSDSGAYPVPADDIYRDEQIIGRSRFVTSIGRARDPDGARSFVDLVRRELLDATHHCWAFVAGPPGSTAHVGLSDAGEPRGTAGRPILDTLLHSGIGEIVAVVTRYFGGAKLGRGGLGRAYSGSVAEALEALEVATLISSTIVTITVPFSATDALFRLLAEIGATRSEERYASEVGVRARVPLTELDRLEGEVARSTSGRGRVEVTEGASDRG